MKQLFTLFSFTTLLLISSCSPDSGPSMDDLKKQAIKNYAQIVFATYDDAYNGALVLQEKISAFVDAPTAEGLEACKTAWKAARIPYDQSDAFRFYGGPIDDENGPEGLINAWPIDESFIDYVSGNATAGLINDPDTYPTISKQVLQDLNESISETSIFTGYHAIEFLLWGQDFHDDGPGDRPYTDYVTGENRTASNQQRRGEYLKVVTALLVDDLGSVRAQWTEDGAYRTAFVNDSNVDEILGRIFTGLSELSKGELAGERMLVAAESHDQEDEHSCFSDFTLTDLKNNYQGIKNVFNGTYNNIAGTSFQVLGNKVDKAKVDLVMASFDDVNAKFLAIPEPFDQAIKNNPESIVATAEALSKLSDQLADVALAIGAKQ